MVDEERRLSKFGRVDCWTEGGSLGGAIVWSFCFLVEDDGPEGGWCWTVDGMTEGSEEAFGMLASSMRAARRALGFGRGKLGEGFDPEGESWFIRAARCFSRFERTLAEA
jgi:hypothetical protein